MPCVIRRDAGEKYENLVELEPGEWRLAVQIEGLEVWLRENRNQLDRGEEWVADIGFCVRPDARGGGPIIRKELMEMCLEVNMGISFSEYPSKAL